MLAPTRGPTLTLADTGSGRSQAAVLPTFRPFMASVSGRVSQDAYDGWRKLSSDTGASVQVLLEFIGENMDAVVDRKRLADLLRAAKEETADRRRHGGPRRRPLADE